MKLWVLAVVFAIIGAAYAGFKDLGDGRPGCATDVEMNVIYYRNLWDPTAYWHCQTRNVAAVPVRCDDGAFQDKLKKCVSWEDWEWEDAKQPPSLANA